MQHMTAKIRKKKTIHCWPVGVDGGSRRRGGAGPRRQHVDERRVLDGAVRVGGDHAELARVLLHRRRDLHHVVAVVLRHHPVSLSVRELAHALVPRHCSPASHARTQQHSHTDRPRNSGSNRPHCCTPCGPTSLTLKLTRSSAIAEWPRDASCQ